MDFRGDVKSSWLIGQVFWKDFSHLKMSDYLKIKIKTDACNVSMLRAIFLNCIMCDNVHLFSTKL